MSYLSEADIEQLLIEQFQNLGYTYLPDVIASPDGSQPERESYSDVILARRLKEAIARLNPTIPPDARDDAFKKLIATAKPNLIEENRRLHQALVEGVDVEYTIDGTIRGDKVYAIDFANPENNDWLVLNQFTVIENSYNRRPDVVVFINGLPIAVIEIKNPSSESATLTAAYNQLQTYKSQITSLFRTNALLIITDGLTARIGSLTADLERFMPWRTIDGERIAPKGTPEMQVLIEGVFAKQRLLDLVQNFIVFGDTGSGIYKIIAGYHQFHAVKKAVARTIAAIQSDRKVGVIWHTQGSGKSLLMAFYAGQLVRRPELENPTLVVITDRNDLDDQLFATFNLCRDLIRQNPQQAENREDLQAILSRAAGGVIFTTMQKFLPERGESRFPLLSDRRNVIVIADEAHRSQYGFRAKVDQKTGEIAYGGIL
jgi:Type I site-specific restriction-modification system, R (restriction) subunit and related helicases